MTDLWNRWGERDKAARKNEEIRKRVADGTATEEERRAHQLWNAMGDELRNEIDKEILALFDRYEREQCLVAAAIAHRACTGTEHDPLNGKLHGCCVVCGDPWPCTSAARFLPPGPEGGK